MDYNNESRKLWNALRTERIEKVMIEIIKEIYHDNVNYVKQGNYFYEPHPQYKRSFATHV